MHVTVTEAAKVWEENKRIIMEADPKLKAAGEILKKHFRKTGKNNYRDRIGYARTVRMTLDRAKVDAELGDRLSEFKKASEVESLSLLKP